MESYMLMRKHISFDKKWVKLVGKIESLNQDSLEEYDELLTQLRKEYTSSSVRIIQKYLKESDDYWPKLKELNAELNKRVNSKFDKLLVEAELLVGNPETVEDVDVEKKYFEEAIERLKMLAAFHKRWNPKRIKELESLRILISKKHTTLLKETNIFKNVKGYRTRLEMLDRLTVEMDKLYDWYGNNYLNLSGKNKKWWCGDEKNVCVELPEDTAWVPVHFRDTDLGRAPLEHLKRMPAKKELQDMRNLLNKFLEFYAHHGLITKTEKYHLRSYDFFLSYIQKYSLFSEDADERLKAALLEQISRLHTVIQDTLLRQEHKKQLEDDYNLSFVSYFASVDEIYRILMRGHISSADSLVAKSEGIDKGVSLKMHPKIHEGDIGFIFPVTKLASKHLFLQMSKDGQELHLFNKKNPGQHVKVDIRDGIFLAPKYKMLHYHIEEQRYIETYEQYFRKFFHHMAKNPPEWFDAGRTEGWLSRHCIFYDEKIRHKLLQMLDNKSFVHVINKYTNRKVDNLALYQQPGSIESTNNFKIYEFGDVFGNKERQAMILFEWAPKE